MKEKSEVNLEEPIFVVGIGRSGTTLIMSMLGSHSEIAFPPEFMFPKHYLCQVKVNAKVKRGGIDVLKNDLKEDSNFQRLEMDPESIIDEVHREYDEPTMLDLYRHILKLCAESKGKTRVGDKYPRNIEILPELARLFADAYVVHIIRDPRDTIGSRLKTEWGKKRHFLTHCAVYREILRISREEGRELFGERYMELRYEDLLQQPEEELRRISEGVGVEYERGMLNFQDSAREIVQEDEESFKGNNLKPLKKDNTGKWKKRLSKRQVKFIEGICSGLMSDYGYKPIYKDRYLFHPLKPIYTGLRWGFKAYKKIRFASLRQFESFSGLG